jgi:hypothetical protein
MSPQMKRRGENTHNPAAALEDFRTLHVNEAAARDFDAMHGLELVVVDLFPDERAELLRHAEVAMLERLLLRVRTENQPVYLKNGYSQCRNRRRGQKIPDLGCFRRIPHNSVSS